MISLFIHCCIMISLFICCYLFVISSLKSLMGSFNTVCETFCNRLANMADGKTMLTMLHELNRATLDAIGKVRPERTWRFVRSRRPFWMTSAGPIQKDATIDNLINVLGNISNLSFSTSLAQCWPNSGAACIHDWHNKYYYMTTFGTYSQ